jgi:two-component system cell cycle response regulator
MGSPPSKPDEPPPRDRRHNATQVVDVDPSSRRTRAVMTVTGGKEAGRVLSLSGGQLVTFGRVDDCTYAFDDPSLSREHARLLRVGEDWVLKDNGSTNGTFVNDKRITSATSLGDGDRVQLGQGTSLRFTLVDEAEEHALRKVYEAANRDALTGAFNRKHLEERLSAELEAAGRDGNRLSVIIGDVDFFKKVNDTHGHLAGDAVLKAVARKLAESVRPEDLVARYGGEEFVVLARGLDQTEAVDLAERLRAVLAAEPVPWEDKKIPITASLGVASLTCCGPAASKEKLLGTADGRLYRAKETGRNRVVG